MHQHSEQYKSNAASVQMRVYRSRARLAMLKKTVREDKSDLRAIFLSRHWILSVCKILKKATAAGPETSNVKTIDWLLN